ncbi:hypothetical protein Emag_004709 [Eimeria magna]
MHRWLLRRTVCSDDTLEVRENLPPRGVNKRFSIFLRRGKVLKGNVASVGPSDPLPPKTAFLRLPELQAVDPAACEEASSEAKRAHEDGRPFEPQDFIIGSTIVIDQQVFRLLAKAGPASLVQRVNDGQQREQMLVYLKRLWEGFRGSDVATKGMFTGCDEVAHKARRFLLILD